MKQNECEQSKAVSVIYDKRISVCFDYVKRIEGKKPKILLILFEIQNIRS